MKAFLSFLVYLYMFSVIIRFFKRIFLFIFRRRRKDE